VQAGASEAGRQLAAETAEVIFGAEASLDAAKRFYADIRQRMRGVGRDPASLKILPALLVVVGDSVADAQAKRAHLDSLVHYDSGIGSLNSALGFDVSGFDPDGPLPEIPETNASRSQRERMLTLAREGKLTIRQLAQKAGSYAGLAFVGTPQSIADEMEQWLVEEGSDGFNVMFPWLPGGLDDFVQKVVPELQRRGIFRRDYAGRTLREHLGLARPANRFFASA
jgi:alkanesulfonate monooxygenase